jgi:hypothetical protein
VGFILKCSEQYHIVFSSCMYALSQATTTINTVFKLMGKCRVVAEFNLNLASMVHTTGMSCCSKVGFAQTIG